MIWPFSKEKPDDRQPTDSAVAIAASLQREPERWTLLGDNYLKHDSGVTIGTGGFTWRPNLDDEPDANGTVICEAVDRWVAARMTMPPVQLKAPEPEGAK